MLLALLILTMQVTLIKGGPLQNYVFNVGGTTMSWKGTLQHSTALSTIKAECVALVEAVKEAFRLFGLFGELFMKKQSTSMFYDSQIDIYLAKDTMFHEQMKHIGYVVTSFMIFFIWGRHFKENQHS